MRKHFIWTFLVLAALTACNKETELIDPTVDNGQPEEKAGKVTLTFKATISEETRTIYANDKTASWEAGDKISVCLTDSESYDVVDFTTEDGVTFTGEVNPGYTTPVSAIYPANEVYTTYSWNSYFSQDDGSVTAVRLPKGYDLADADDTGRFIPLIGSFDGENMTFHHFCSAMKVTLTNIPEDAAYFTFTTNNQKLVWDFSLSNGRISLVSQEEDVDTSVYFEFEPGSLTTRSFYIPIPDGTLAADSDVSLLDAGGADLFKKRITSSPTFGLNTNGKDAIRVLPAVACWTRNEAWTAYYYGAYKTTSETVNKRIRIENVTAPFYYEVISEQSFNDLYNDSVVEYLSSAHFAERVAGAKVYTDGYLNVNYTSISKGKKFVMVFGLDDDKNFSGEYNCIEVVVPTFTNPTGWNISVTENATNYSIRYVVPKTDTQWQYVSFSTSDFETKYLNDLECAIYTAIRSSKASHEEDPTKWAPRTGTNSYIVSYSGDYILLSVGIDENYRPTGAYFRLDYNFTKEDPTEAYNKWIGKWTVNDGANTDTWTIARRRANHTYTITGMCNRSYPVEALFDEDGGILVKSQKNIAIVTASEEERVINLYMANANAFYSANNTEIMAATLEDDDHAALSPLNETYPRYQFIGSCSTGNYNYTKRPATATMTRVTE